MLDTLGALIEFHTTFTETIEPTLNSHVRDGTGYCMGCRPPNRTKIENCIHLKAATKARQRLRKSLQSRRTTIAYRRAS